MAPDALLPAGRFTKFFERHSSQTMLHC
jgi:hypothetical protein